MTLVAHICAWCKRTLELELSSEPWPESESGYAETHTICPACAEALEA